MSDSSSRPDDLETAIAVSNPSRFVRPGFIPGTSTAVDDVAQDCDVLMHGTVEEAFKKLRQTGEITADRLQAVASRISKPRVRNRLRTRELMRIYYLETYLNRMLSDMDESPEET